MGPVEHELNDLMNMITEPNCPLCGHHKFDHITFEVYEDKEPAWFVPCAQFTPPINEYTPCGCLRYMDCLYEEE